MEDREKWNEFKEWIRGFSDDEFYEECVECRESCFHVDDELNDDKEYFFDLVNAYAENKYEQLINKMKCCGNCKYNDEGVCQEYIVQNCPHESSCLCGGNYCYWELMEEE